MLLVFIMKIAMKDLMVETTNATILLVVRNWLARKYSVNKWGNENVQEIR